MKRENPAGNNQFPAMLADGIKKLPLYQLISGIRISISFSY